MNGTGNATFVAFAILLLLVLAIAWFWKSRGVWGWLIIPAVGATLAPLYIVLGIVTAVDLQPRLNPGELSTAIIWIDLVVYAVFLVAAVLLLLRLYFRRASFPRSYVVISIAAIVFAVVDTVLWMVALGADVFTAGYMIQTAAALAIAAAWISYMQRSVRVRETFVN